MIREIVPFFFVLRTFIFKLTVLVFGLVAVVWISFAIYGSFYYAYLPMETMYHLPVNFQFDPCPIEFDRERCSFLKATVDFSQDDHDKNHENDLLKGKDTKIPTIDGPLSNIFAEYLCGCAHHNHTLCGCAHSVRRVCGRLFQRECAVSVHAGKYQVCGVREFVQIKKLEI